jgi:hypothetical protein
MVDWLTKNILPLDVLWVALLWAGSTLLLISTAGLVLLAVLLIRLPAGHFTEDASLGHGARESDLPFALKMLKNLSGGVLILVGGILALPGIPGPGLLILLSGIMLTDFRGKRRLELWLVRRPGVLITINKVRACFARPPMFVLPD